ncbi:MAG: hypothetical protein NT118_05140, partial [Lentisphaerae bacterium]|nr:hypothetical protein [Lentisphaerota bacterium]
MNRVYLAHCSEYGTGIKYQVSPKTIQERLKSKGCQVQRKHSGRGWQGVGIKQEWGSGVHPAINEPGRDGVTSGDGISDKTPFANGNKDNTGNSVTGRHGVTPLPETESSGTENAMDEVII